jgi:hypothetical protein
MSKELVDDFINNTGTKEIPEDESVAIHSIPMFLPLYTEPVGIPVQPIIDMTPEERMRTFKEFIKDIRSVCSMFKDIAHLDKLNNPDEIYEEIKDTVWPFAASIGIKFNLAVSDKWLEISCILVQVYGYLTEITRWMAAEYSITYDPDDDQVVQAAVSDDVDEQPGESDELEDSRFLDMLAAEMMGATQGNPFSDKELFGEDKK